jgi:hypothetical protein
MLWEMISLRRFAAGAPTQTSIERRLAGSEPRILEISPEIDPLLAEICDRAIHVDPQKRYPTAERFRADLQQYLLVMGEEPALPLGDLMCQKFATERAEMRRLIDEHAKRDERMHSGVRDLPHAPGAAQGGEPGGDKATLIGDLSSLIEKTRADRRVDGEPVEWEGSLRRSRRPYVWAGLAALLVLGSVASLRFDGRGPAVGWSNGAAKVPTPALPAAEARPEAAPASAETEAGEHAGRAASTNQGNAAADPGLPSSDRADPVATERAEPAGRPAGPSRGRGQPPTAASGGGLRSRVRGEAEPAERSGRGENAEPSARAAGWRARTEAASTAEGGGRARAGVAGWDANPASEKAAGRARAPAGIGELEIGEDVRPRMGRARGIDLQDPYQ